MADDQDTIVGIDLGTTNSAVAVMQDGIVRVLPNALGELLTPSAIAWDERADTMLVGRAAKDIAALHPARSALLFKRDMGTDRTVSVGAQQLGAIACSALVLRQLREDASAALGHPVDRCVITVPAYFNEAQRFATQQAGELAGFTVERILNEPTAAAIAYGQHARHSDAQLLVFDLGGGTFDVCIMDRFEGALEVRSVAGASDLGGEDFSRRIASLALRQVGESFEVFEMQAPAALSQLLRRAELLKRRMPDDVTDAPLAIEVPAREPDVVPRPVAMLPSEIREAWRPLLERLVGPLRAALRSAELNRTDIDEIILVGGATRSPEVRSVVDQYFARTSLRHIDPDLAIVVGAATQAALYMGDAAVSDLVVTDVASHSLGIDVTKEFGTTRRDGFFSPIIHRNSVIPTSRTESYFTMDPNQTRMTIGIYEGEARRVEENRKIGELRVKGIPKGPAGQEVEVTFTFDLNGILEVEARIPETGRSFKRVFKRDGSALSARELGAIATRFERLKADPRDRSEIRETLARAELLLHDLSPEARVALERVMDALEHAIEGRDPKKISLWIEQLREHCKRIDGGERW